MKLPFILPNPTKSEVQDYQPCQHIEIRSPTDVVNVEVQDIKNEIAHNTNVYGAFDIDQAIILTNVLTPTIKDQEGIPSI